MYNIFQPCSIAKQRITAESDFSCEFGRTTRRGQRHIGIGFQTVVRGQKVFTPMDKKVAKSIFLSFLTLRGRRCFSSLIFLWPGSTSGTPAASILSSLRPLPSTWARADVDTRTGLSLCTHHRAKAVYEAAINLSVYVRTILKLKKLPASCNQRQSSREFHEWLNLRETWPHLQVQICLIAHRVLRYCLITQYRIEVFSYHETA